MNYISDTQAAQAAEKLSRLTSELQQVLFGQSELIEQLVTALIANGHVLLEGLPGLGKTQLIKGLARAVDLEVKRIQFTPDLLPGDITGNPILEEAEGKRRFTFQRGPIFTNFLLADEINRASPKTQSALLEAMQESRVSVMGQTHELPRPFFVLATQNPIELEGTYPLPEAQLDRFLFKLDVHRTSTDTLAKIISHRHIGEDPEVRSVLTGEELSELMLQARQVFLPEVVVTYIARLVDFTHKGQSQAAAGVKYGASPRAALAIAAAARARALIRGRINASFEDVSAVAIPALQHRLILEYGVKLSGMTPGDVVRQILEVLPVDNHQTAPLVN